VGGGGGGGWGVGGNYRREINVPKIIAVPNATLCGTYIVKRSKKNLSRNVPRFNVLPHFTFNINYPVIPAFLSFLVLSLLPTQCRCRELLLHLITLKPHTHPVELQGTRDQPVAQFST